MRRYVALSSSIYISTRTVIKVKLTKVSETNIFSNVSQCPSQLDFVTVYYFLLSVYTVVCVVTSNLDRDPIITFQAPSPEFTCASTSRDPTNTSQSRYFRSMMSSNTNKCSKSGTRRKCCRWVLFFRCEASP